MVAVDHQVQGFADDIPDVYYEASKLGKRNNGTS